MDPIELAAMNIIKGEMQGDQFLWEVEWYDREGKPQKGGWKSAVEGNRPNG